MTTDDCREREGLSVLSLRTKPKPRLLPSVPRTMKAVDSELVGIFRDLVAGRRRWPLFLHGSVGRGKSAASLALCDFAETAEFFTVEEICGVDMRGSDAERLRLKDGLRKASLFIIDELGTRSKVSDLPYMAVKRCLDEREAFQRRRLIAISNLPLDKLKDMYDARISSRLSAGTVFELKGHDRRIES
jgi:DNA replication protein DnaC